MNSNRFLFRYHLIYLPVMLLIIFVEILFLLFILSILFDFSYFVFRDRSSNNPTILLQHAGIDIFAVAYTYKNMDKLINNVDV